MTDDEVIQRLNRARAYLVEKTDKLLQDVGAVEFSALDENPLTVHFEAELDNLLFEGATQHPSPSELRRIAELTEMLRGDEAAVAWWRLAAEAGDPDSIEMLEYIEEEKL